jgi:hypothetical protein
MLIALICISAGLGAIILFLLLAIVVRRVRLDRHRRRYDVKVEVWEPLFFAYLDEEPTGRRIAATLKTRDDFDAFAEFITFYLKNLAGEDFRDIRDLALETGLKRHLYMDLGGGRGPKRQAVAAITLGLMEDTDVLPYLKKMLESKDPYLVYAGAYGIACLRENGLFMKVMRLLLTRTPITYEGANELLVRFGMGICPMLVGVMRDALIRHERGEGEVEEAPSTDSLRLELDNFIETSMLIDIIGYFRYGEADELLLRIMEESGNDEVTIHVLKAMVRLEPPGVAARIAHLLEHPNWVIRSQAARVMGVLGDRDFQGDLEALLDDREWWVRHYAIQALQALA